MYRETKSKLNTDKELDLAKTLNDTRILLSYGFNYSGNWGLHVVGIIDYTYVNPVVYIESIGEELSEHVLPANSIIRRVSHESLKDAFFLLKETLHEPYVIYVHNAAGTAHLSEVNVWFNNNIINNILCTTPVNGGGAVHHPVSD